MSSIRFLGLSIITFLEAPVGSEQRKYMDICNQRNKKSKYRHRCHKGYFRTLTLALVDGYVDDLIGSDDTIRLCWLCPADLSDSGADDIESQATRFTRYWRGKIMQMHMFVRQKLQKATTGMLEMDYMLPKN